MSLPIDHILYGVPDLDEGIEAIHRLTGVRPVVGGSHPGLGTRNALLGLGADRYLEIIAPDPDQEVDKVWMNLDQLKAPRLFRWAAFQDNLGLLVTRAAAQNLYLGEIKDGQRRTTSGALLQWKLTDPNVLLGDGVVPFFIDWGPGGNPTPTLPTGCMLESFTAYHPDPSAVESMLKILDLDLKVIKADQPKLKAVLSSPRGRVILE